MNTTDNSLLATLALKKLAANKTYRDLFLQSETLRDFLRPAALGGARGKGSAPVDSPLNHLKPSVRKSR